MVVLRSASNIINSFLPIFYLSKYYGCNLYPLPKELNSSNQKMNLRAVDVLIYLVHICLAFGVIIPFIEQFDDPDSALKQELESKISLSSVAMLSLIGSLANYSYVFIYLFIAISDMINARAIRKIFLLFISIDEQVQEQGVKLNLSYKHISRLHAVMFVLTQIVTIAFGLMLMGKQVNGNVLYLFQLYIASVMADGCISSFFVTYWFFLENLADRFFIVNELLKQYLNQIKEKLSSDSLHSETRLLDGSNLKPDQVRKLSSLYHIVINIVNKINSCYTLQFISCISMIFSFLVINSFTLYKTLTVDSGNTSPIIEIFYTSRSFNFNFLVYKVIAAGSRIKHMKRITQSLLNKACTLCKNEEVNNELKHFSYQISHSNIDITCGLFTVDWTLFYTISSAVGSYLLLFIQFDSISSSNS